MKRHYLLIDCSFIRDKNWCESALAYSKATKARLDSQKLQELGWKASFSIQKGVDRTIKVLTEIK